MSEYKPLDKASAKYKSVIRIQEGFGFGWTRQYNSTGDKFISVILRLPGGELMQFQIYKNKEKCKETHPDWRVRKAEKLTFKSSQFMDTAWLHKTMEVGEDVNPVTPTPNSSYISSDSQSRPENTALKPEGQGQQE